MPPAPVVTGLSPKEGPPGTKVTIRGEFLGTRHQDLIGLNICGCDCLLSADWKSPNKIIARTGPNKGKGDIIVTTVSGGVGSCTVQFRAYHETIGPTKESAVWVEESPLPTIGWGHRSLAPIGYTQEDPLGLSIEGNEKKIAEDLRDIFADGSGDLSQENFSPGWFLLQNHHSTSFEDLKAGLSYLKRKVENQKEGQLSFLKSNAGSVIEQLDKLMLIRDKLEEDYSFDTQQLEVLTTSINSAIEESENIFTGLMKRREKADVVRSALVGLSRHKFLFCLPQNIVKNAKLEEYDLVVNDYARAKNLFAKPEIEIFARILEEADRRVEEVQNSLLEKVAKMPQSVEQQKLLIKAYVSLEVHRTGNLPTDKKHDPGWIAIQARGDHLKKSLKKTFDLFCEKEVNVERTKLRDGLPTPARVMFCEDICEVAASELPDIWILGQLYFSGDIKGSNMVKAEDFKEIIMNGIEEFCNYFKAAIIVANEQKHHRQSTPYSWPNSSTLTQGHVYLPQCLRFVRITYSTLIRLDVPNEALDILQKLINEIRLNCLTSIFKKSIEKLKKLHKHENWIMGVEEFSGATLLPSHFEEILVETLEQSQNLCVNPEIREKNLLDPDSDGQKEVCRLFSEMLNTFSDVIEKLAFQDDFDQIPKMSQLIGFSNSGNQDRNSKGSNDSPLTGCQQMLCSMANCVYCCKHFFSHLKSAFVKFGFPIPTSAIEHGISNMNQLFHNLLEAYVEQKCDVLVGTIEPSMYIKPFQWDNFTAIGNLRPYAHECCDNLVTVFSEINSISPFLLKEILQPIVQTVAEELARLMSCVQNFSENGAIQAHVDIRVLKDTLELYSTDVARSFFTEALEAIQTLSPQQSVQVEEIVKKVKFDMRLQLSCFLVTVV